MEYNYWQILLLSPQIDHFGFNPVFHQFSERNFRLIGWKANSSTETWATRTAFSTTLKLSLMFVSGLMWQLYECEESL